MRAADSTATAWNAAGLLSLAAARVYASYGWLVFPARDKTPRVQWKTQATTELRQIEQWWGRWPQANVAIVTGSRSGIFVLDVDGSTGEESLAELEARHGKLPATREARTGKGRHLYFDLPEDIIVRNSAGALGEGLDVRGEGGYVIAPPSDHAATGGHYDWVAQVVPASAPRWLTARLISETQSLIENEIPEGKRNSTLTSIAGSLRRQGYECDEIEAAIAGENERCMPPLEDLEVRSIAQSVARYAPALIKAIPRNRVSASKEPRVLRPQPLREVAWRGVFGQLVQAIAPQTEADPAGVLIQILTMFGNSIGRSAYWRVEADTHYLNLNVVLVGATGKGRKGTSGGHAIRVMEQVDPDWARTRRTSGLSSGEGLIWAVRDPIEKQEAIREKGRVKEYQTVVDDPGIPDKRLLVVESEFSSALRVLNRDGNTLSALMRQAWDGQDLRALTKNSPATASRPHISVIGQITRDELRRDLDRTETANGFGNRFLWVYVDRSRLLPDGGKAVDVSPFIERIREAADFARNVGEIRRDDDAGTHWRRIYKRLSAGRPGMLGAMTARAEAQVMRLACLFAIGDLSELIHVEHLRAAIEVWRYCFDSAAYIFGDRLGDPTADDILSALRKASPGGLTRTDLLHDVFGKNKHSADIGRALRLLEQFSLARPEEDRTGEGRPAERWFASQLDDVDDINDISLESFDPTSSTSSLS